MRPHSVRFLFLGLATLLAATLPVKAQQQAPVPAVDPTDRQQVIDLYNNFYVPSNDVPTGWNGDVAAGNPGNLSEDFRTATVRRINYYRAMTGLAGNIVLGSAENTKCQQAALMFAAQNDLSHSPPSNWKFYTPDAAQAAYNSNIRLDTVGDEGPGAVDRFMADNESNNTYVGHRRWLIFASEGAMGTGAIPASSSNPGTAAIWIMNLVSRPAGAPAATAWPPAGFVPADLVYPRWSYSYQNADFGAAKVSVTKNGAPVTVNQETPVFSSTGPGTAFLGDNTLVWELPGDTVSQTADEVYVVHIENVRLAGATKTVDYTVTTIDATPAPAPAPTPTPDPTPDPTTPPATGANLPSIRLTAVNATAHRATGKKAKIVLTRDGDILAPLTIAYAIGGTATPGQFYKPLQGTVTFLAGENTATIIVKPKRSTGPTRKKTVIVTLQPSDGYTLGDTADATVLIKK